MGEMNILITTKKTRMMSTTKIPLLMAMAPNAHEMVQQRPRDALLVIPIANAKDHRILDYGESNVVLPESQE
jgi:hypothetical protein